MLEGFALVPSIETLHNPKTLLHLTDLQLWQVDSLNTNPISAVGAESSALLLRLFATKPRCAFLEYSSS
jgi:hypothetical protein